MAQPAPDARRAEKQARFATSGRSGKKKRWLLALALAGVSALAAWSARSGGPAAAETPQAVSAEIVIPLSRIEGGKAAFFEYPAGGRKVRFFVLRSSDGVYRAALDSCDVCYDAKLGYYQDGDDMVCRKCRRRFPSSLVNEVSGGCNPVPVPRRVQDGNLVLKAADLERGVSYF